MPDSHNSASARNSRERHMNRGLRKRCGCARSKWNKCAHPWHFNYKPDVGPNKGKHFRISLDKHLHRRIEGKTEAEREARNLRTAIDEGRFGVPVPTRDTLTVEQLLRAYLRDYVTPERPRSVGNVAYQIAAIARTPVELLTEERRAFGAWLVVDVTTGAVEKFRAARRTQALVTVRDQDGRDRARLVGGALTTNRNLALLRAAFNWAIRLGHFEATPFKRHSETVVKLSKETARRRRLEGDEGSACSRPVIRCCSIRGRRSRGSINPRPGCVRSLKRRLRAAAGGANCSRSNGGSEGPRRRQPAPRSARRKNEDEA